MKTTRVLAALAVVASFATPAIAAEAQPMGGNATVTHDADNTARNVRDRDRKTLTPMDQSANDADRRITQTIRQEVVANKALSTNAHNVKIITVNGVVTLRGPVKNEDEKSAIAAVAQRVAGVTKVDDQLEIEARE